MLRKQINLIQYSFLQLLVDKLKGETITWEQPWYQQSKSLSRPFKNDKNESHTEPYRTDTICKAESDLIEDNWHEFKKVKYSNIYF